MAKLRYDRKYTKELYHKCIHSYPHYLYARCIHTDLPSRKYIGDANHCEWNTVKRGGWIEPKKRKHCGWGEPKKRKPMQSKLKLEGVPFSVLSRKS